MAASIQATVTTTITRLAEIDITQTKTSDKNANHHEDIYVLIYRIGNVIAVVFFLYMQTFLYVQ